MTCEIINKISEIKSAYEELAADCNCSATDMPSSFADLSGDGSGLIREIYDGITQLVARTDCGYTMVDAPAYDPGTPGTCLTDDYLSDLLTYIDHIYCAGCTATIDTTQSKPGSFVSRRVNFVRDATDDDYGLLWPPGDYEITYLQGALRWTSSPMWQLHGNGANQLQVGYSTCHVYCGDSPEVNSVSGITQLPGDSDEYATEAALEAANTGKTVTITLRDYSAIWIQMYNYQGLSDDFGFEDVTAGSVLPTFSISPCPPDWTLPDMSFECVLLEYYCVDMYHPFHDRTRLWNTIYWYAPWADSYEVYLYALDYFGNQVSAPVLMSQATATQKYCNLYSSTFTFNSYWTGYLRPHALQLFYQYGLSLNQQYPMRVFVRALRDDGTYIDSTVETFVWADDYSHCSGSPCKPGSITALSTWRVVDGRDLNTGADFITLSMFANSGGNYDRWELREVSYNRRYLAGTITQDGRLGGLPGTWDIKQYSYTGTMQLRLICD